MHPARVSGNEHFGLFLSPSASPPPLPASLNFLAVGRSCAGCKTVSICAFFQRFLLPAGHLRPSIAEGYTKSIRFLVDHGSMLGHRRGVASAVGRRKPLVFSHELVIGHTRISRASYRFVAQRAGAQPLASCRGHNSPSAATWARHHRV